MKTLQQILRFRWLLSVALLASLPLVIYGAWGSFWSLSNRIEDWIPADPQLGKFVGMFGSDELLMISWEGCTFDDLRIEKYVEQLERPGPDGEPYFRDAIGGPEILEFYLSEPFELGRDEALDRMKGWIASGDGETTSIVALVSAAGAADRHAAVRFARAAAEQVEGLTPEMLKMAGPTIEGVAIDNASTAHLTELNLLSYGVCLAILAFCFRNIRAALLVFAIAVFNEILALAIIYYAGSPLDSILLLTANLTFVLTISVGVHLVNYYRDILETTPPDEAPARAMRVALKPTFVATATTAIGLVSLGISHVVPLARFGLFSAFSICVAAVIAMVYIAIHFRIWPLAKRNGGCALASHEQEPDTPPLYFRLVERFRVPVIVVVAIVMIGGFLGVQRLKTAVGLRELVSDRTRAAQDFYWLEDTIGPLVPVEVVLEVPSGDARELLAQYRLVEDLHHRLQAIDRADVVISMATFAPESPPPGGGIRQRGRAVAFRNSLLENQEELSGLGYLLTVEDKTYWRLTMRAPTMQEVNYGALLKKARAVVNDTIDAQDVVKPNDVLLVGGLPLIYNVQQQLLEDLIHSFLLAFSLVSVTLMLLFRSVFCGLICMIPNLLPSALVFGLMGWLGWSVEVGTVLTANAALGIAVDDSLHFITWFRRRIDEGGTVAEAVRYAYRRCGTAMIQTTLVCTLGLVVFSLSQFSPTARFGWCMFTLLFVALAGDLIVLPAILLSPLGRPFLPKTHPIGSSLREFAYRVAGPRDLVINCVLNATIAYFVYRNTPRVSLAGMPSLLMYVGPMCFLLPTITTCFGYLNGLMERVHGRAEPPVPAPVAWFAPALRAGLLRGALTCLVCSAVLIGLQRLMPSFTMTGSMAIAAVSLFSGVLGYVFHTGAVIRAAELAPAHEA